MIPIMLFVLICTHPTVLSARACSRPLIKCMYHTLRTGFELLLKWENFLAFCSWLFIDFDALEVPCKPSTLFIISLHKQKVFYDWPHQRFMICLDTLSSQFNFNANKLQTILILLMLLCTWIELLNYCWRWVSDNLRSTLQVRSHKMYIP